MFKHRLATSTSWLKYLLMVSWLTCSRVYFRRMDLAHKGSSPPSIENIIILRMLYKCTMQLLIGYFAQLQYIFAKRAENPKLGFGFGFAHFMKFWGSSEKIYNWQSLHLHQVISTSCGRLFALATIIRRRTNFSAIFPQSSEILIHILMVILKMLRLIMMTMMTTLHLLMHHLSSSPSSL